MDPIGNGLITFLNGLESLLGALASPFAIAAIVVVVSLAWLAIIELDELSRQANKPEVGRH